jgi:RHS repeat-associated protein
VFEPGTFIPVAQAVSDTTLELLPQPGYGDHYSIDRDPVWLHTPTATPIEALAWYQCDQLGTPMELTDADGKLIWRGTYKAWGQSDKAVIQKRISKTKFQHTLRFQGQYYDAETELHYNRHRYYDPRSTRFIGKDPIGFSGSINLYQYTPNPVSWIDPLGLRKCRCDPCEVTGHGSQPSPRPGGKQSHHIIQNAWATENIPGYANGGKQTAPSILLTASPQHATVTTRQNARRDERLSAGQPRWGTSLTDEFNNAYRDLGAAGVSEHCKRKAIKQAYRYFYGE